MASIFRRLRLGFGNRPDSYGPEKSWTAGIDFSADGHVGTFEFNGTDWDVLVDGVSTGSIPGGGGGGGGTGAVFADFDATPGDLIAPAFQPITIPFNYTITSWRIIGGSTGNATFDVTRQTSLGGSSTSIVAAAPPTMTGSATASSSTLTGWTVAGNAGDILTLTLSASAGLSKVRLELLVTK